MNRSELEPITVPNYLYAFTFEKNFVYADTVTTITNHYRYCFLYSVVYIVLIFSGKHYMSNRPKLDLRRVLALWNAFLAIFSTCGFLRMATEMYHTLSNYGFYHSVCNPSFLLQDSVSAFWSLLFILSKLVEFGDTIFIVLRKQTLLFVHWYHHVSVLLYAWLCYVETTAYARWNATINYFIHSWMYSYYFLRAMQFVLPKWISIMITSLQILQMICGCFVTTMTYNYVKNCDHECSVMPHNVIFGLFIYFTYFILFGKFFKDTYLSDKSLKIFEKKNEIHHKIKTT